MLFWEQTFPLYQWSAAEDAGFILCLITNDCMKQNSETALENITQAPEGVYSSESGILNYNQYLLAS